ncbi:hypothetical protein ACS0TY_035492 [Phlomoides rotata]
MNKTKSCHNLNFSLSFMKTCFFLLIFVFMAVFVIGVPLLCLVLILKPKMPTFSLETINVESYKLDISSQNLVVSSVSSLNLRADNPNKVGLSFDSSRFHVLSQGLVVGLIRLPPFHQPPLSKNVSVKMRILFECVNITDIMYSSLRRDDSSNGVFGIRILGYVRAQLHIFHVTLPKIKVALDCDINVSQSKLSVSNIEEVYSMRWNPKHMVNIY